MLVGPSSDGGATHLLESIEAGPGGELKETKSGQVPIASAESSALLTVNFFAPFACGAHEILGIACEKISAERQLRVKGVRAPVGPTLDAVIQGADGTVCVEAKCAEPWRGRPKVDLSAQYDLPAKGISSKTSSTLEMLRDGEIAYRCLDAAQLMKHLLGVHSAIAAEKIVAPAQLMLLFWRPSDPGGFASLFDRLEYEFDDLAERLSNQPVQLVRKSTRELLDEWSATGRALAAHAAALRPRYDVPLTA